MTFRKKVAVAGITTLTFLLPIEASAFASQQTVIRSVSTQVQLHDSKAGQFCKKSDLGKKKAASNGGRIKCVMKNGRARWVRA